jgi:hypothetical protein
MAKRTRGGGEMKWMEMIWVRSSEGFQKGLLYEALERLGELGKEAGADEVKLYSHFFLPGDFLIHLFWEKGSPEQGETPASFKIQNMLKNLGLTNHSTWNEEEIK